MAESAHWHILFVLAVEVVFLRFLLVDWLFEGFVRFFFIVDVGEGEARKAFRAFDGAGNDAVYTDAVWSPFNS